MILARLSGTDPASMAAAREWAMVNDISDGTNPAMPLPASSWWPCCTAMLR